MTKEEIIEFHENEKNRYDNLAKTELHDISQRLHMLANDIDSTKYFNEYQFKKIIKKVEELKKWENMAGISQSIISNITMLDKLD